MVPTKKKAAAEKPVKKADDFSALLAFERFTDYALMDALHGRFDLKSDLDATKAFAAGDTATLNKLADKRKREIKFIEADEVFGDETPDIHERLKRLRATKGTRAYAASLRQKAHAKKKR